MMVDYESFNPDVHEYVDVNDKSKGFVFKKDLIPDTKNYRIITTGSMQRRFTVEEEVMMLQDSTAKVVRDRLFTTSYCDLDFKDTIDGVHYIVSTLASALSWDDEFKNDRINKLLADGDTTEVYDGDL